MRAIVTVIGKDRVGIIADVTGEMEGIFTTQFQAIDQAFRQTFLELFGGGKATLELEDAAQCTVPFADLARTLDEAGTQRGLQIRAQREDIFNAMHRI